MNNQNYDEVIDRTNVLNNLAKAEFEKGNYNQSFEYANQSIINCETINLVPKFSYLIRAISRVLNDFTNGELTSSNLIKSRDDVNYYIYREYSDFLKQNEETKVDFFWFIMNFLVLSYEFNQLSNVPDDSLKMDENEATINKILKNVSILDGYNLSDDNKISILFDSDFYGKLVDIVNKTPEFKKYNGQFANIESNLVSSYLYDMFSNYRLNIMKNGNTYFRRDDLRKALYWYNLATAVMADDEEYNEAALVKKGICFFELNKFKYAITCFEEALKVNPNNGVTKQYYNQCIEKLK